MNDALLLERLHASEKRNEELCASLEQVVAECGAFRRDYEALVDATQVITDDRDALRQRMVELEASNKRLVDMLWGRRSERRTESPDQQHLNFGDDPVDLPSAEQQEIITAQTNAD